MVEFTKCLLRIAEKLTRFRRRSPVLLAKRQGGQSLTEFALLLPLMLVLLCGIIDIGRMAHAYMELNLVAQEAARLGGLGHSDAEIRAFAANRLDPAAADLTVTITPDDASRRSGDYVEVRLGRSFEYVTPLISRVLPSPYQVAADSTIRVE